MGKGFNNYMCKKFFHPASADNLKRVWIAQKKTEVEKKKQDELRTQYDREQELYQNKALLSKESKDKLELNFMYEPPPGVKKIGEEEKGEGGEPEYKFEWQRTWGHAPKESYLEKGDDFMEQPFGIQVCQAKCIKCGKFGHMNTDKRCPLYGKSLDHDAPIQNVDQNKLIEEMKAEGLAMRYSSWDLKKEVGPNHAMVEEEKGVDRVELLKTMSKEEKKKLLKKLKKMEKKEAKRDKKKRKKGSKSDSEDDWQEKKIKGAASPEIYSKNGDKRMEDERKQDRSRSKDKRRKSDSGDKPRKRSESREDRSDRKRDNWEKKMDRSENRDRKREKRSDSRDRKRSRSDSRDRKRDRSDSRDRKRDRSVSRERRRERPVSRDRKKEDRRRDRN
ncbi:corepressor interacting with RBPJ 1 [Eurytemora carolleeae]|uniref:corepressor interacting with RBPJ 1 n=1 Tax=Eurytemora carolleeae TaxID=1294199 RepID=UPI000C775A8D|nr:corepressor interacting with RBPJ 1 [Eurytemora carolleeae]|eukprot:XP_023334187.1 corepressor interacting with RBPJ 1-like [Eurytemora affinis]